MARGVNCSGGRHDENPSRPRQAQHEALSRSGVSPRQLRRLVSRLAVGDAGGSRDGGGQAPYRLGTQGARRGRRRKSTVSDAEVAVRAESVRRETTCLTSAGARCHPTPTNAKACVFSSRGRRLRYLTNKASVRRTKLSLRRACCLNKVSSTRCSSSVLLRFVECGRIPNGANSRSTSGRPSQRA